MTAKWLNVERLDDRIVPTTFFNLQDQSGLQASVGTVYVAGFINGNQVLQSDGTFATSGSSSAPFYPVGSIPQVQLSTATNGNDRLVFTVSPTTPSNYPLDGYTAYPFNGLPAVAPSGPYDIFEFGLNAQDDLSAVDSFGLNLSFTGDPSFPNVTYGVLPQYSRAAVQAAWSAFTAGDPEGADFQELLYSSPATQGYPPLINGQFSAIVSPKDWLAIYPSDQLSTYWTNTLSAFFTVGNQISIDLGPGLGGVWTGSFDGTNYVLTNSASQTENVPAGIFTPTFPFVEGYSPTDGTEGQLVDQIIEAMERGVALDGVVAQGQPIASAYSTTAWTDTANWYTNHLNAYNNTASVYDVYSKFFHYSTINGTDFRDDPGSQPIFGLNAAGLFGQAYGFSLDENPNGGSTTTWSLDDNVPAKTPNGVPDGTTLTITVGPWDANGPTVTAVSPGSGPPGGGTPVTITGSGFTGATAVNFGGTQLSPGSFTVNAAGTAITLTSPPGAVGTVDVTVTTPAGTSGTTVADKFSYTTSYFAVGSGAGARSEVKVYAASGNVVRSLSPFGSFTGGVRVATGDVNGDGIDDVIAAQGPGGRSVVKVYDGATFAVLSRFTAFPQHAAQRHHVGAFVAAADVNHDGRADVVVGADAGWKPLVRVYDGTTGTLVHQFEAFGSRFAGGVRVAAGDINKDGFAEVVAAAGRGSRVSVFDGQTYAPALTFTAYRGEDNRGGVWVAVGDLPGSTTPSIVTGTGPGIAFEARVYDGKTGRYLDQIVRGNSRRVGIPVAVFDADGDGSDEVLLGRDPGQPAVVDLWQFNPATGKWLMIDSITSFGNDGGAFVG